MELAAARHNSFRFASSFRSVRSMMSLVFTMSQQVNEVSPDTSCIVEGLQPHKDTMSNVVWGGMSFLSAASIRGPVGPREIAAKVLTEVPCCCIQVRRLARDS